MNLYLDIDGVILHQSKASVHADDFLQLIAHNWPHSTYWISSYAKQGKVILHNLLQPYLKPKTMHMIETFQIASWRNLKTDAINFKQPFLWFDDTLYPEEEKILKHYSAEQCYRPIRLHSDPHQLIDEISFLKSLL